MINSIIENRNGGTMVTEFPCNINRLCRELRLIDIRCSPDRIRLTDEEENPICVKLYADSDIGNHLIRILSDKDSLEDVNDVATVVMKANALIREDLEQQIIHDQYSSVRELYKDIRQMLFEAGSVSETFYFPLVGNVYDEDYDNMYEISNSFLADHEDQIREALEKYMERDTQNMARYYDGSGKEKVLLADWDLIYLNRTLYGKVDIRLTEAMADGEKEQLKEWICGQNSDGLGEGFEQQDIRTEGGDLNVSFWHSGGDYFVYDQTEMDVYIENQNNFRMEGI